MNYIISFEPLDGFSNFKKINYLKFYQEFKLNSLIFFNSTWLNWTQHLDTCWLLDKRGSSAQKSLTPGSSDPKLAWSWRPKILQGHRPKMPRQSQVKSNPSRALSPTRQKGFRGPKTPPQAKIHVLVPRTPQKFHIRIWASCPHHTSPRRPPPPIRLINPWWDEEMRKWEETILTQHICLSMVPNANDCQVGEGVIHSGQEQSLHSML